LPTLPGMTDAAYTAICLLIDRSGSMQSIKDATEDAINGFVQQQVAEEGRRTIRIATFDTGAPEQVCPSTPASEVPRFTLHPRGSTALLDAMGTTITAFGAELTGMDENTRPGHVVFAVMTDGLENASTDYTWAQIKKMVEHQERVYGWNVVYLGANQDAIQVGAQLGVRRGSSLTYTADAHTTRSAVGSTSAYVTEVAAGRKAAFTDAQRHAATDQ
jgi:hypothetical protein